MVKKSGFFGILEFTVVNSYIIYQHACNEMKQKCVHLAFRRELIHHLIEPLLTSRLQPTIPHPFERKTEASKQSLYGEKIVLCVVKEVKMECVTLPFIVVQPVLTIHHFVLGNDSSCITLKRYIRKKNELLYIVI